MLEDLVKLANHLDDKGLIKKADFIDFMIRKVSQEEPTDQWPSQNLSGQTTEIRPIGAGETEGLVMAPNEAEIANAFKSGRTSAGFVTNDVNRFLVSLLYKVLTEGFVNFRMLDSAVESLKELNPSPQKLRDSIVAAASHIGAVTDMQNLYKLEEQAAEKTFSQQPEALSEETERELEELGVETWKETTDVFHNISFEEFYSNRVGAMAMAALTLFDEYLEETQGLPEKFEPQPQFSPRDEAQFKRQFGT